MQGNFAAELLAFYGKSLIGFRDCDKLKAIKFLLNFHSHENVVMGPINQHIQTNIYI